jgi:citrate lyase synthetase
MKFLFTSALFISCCTSAINSEVVASPEVVSTPNVTDIYICEASQGVGSDLSFVGKYSASQEQHDGVPVYTSENDMSFFRNTGFW